MVTETAGVWFDTHDCINPQTMRNRIFHKAVGRLLSEALGRALKNGAECHWLSARPTEG
jgi:hypothetical protein